METRLYVPETLLEAINHYDDEQNCFNTMVALRWPNGTCCPRCGDTNVTLFKTRPLFKCNGCKKQFTVKVGTVFEDSPLPLSKWLPAVWLLTNAKNGISSCELAKALGVQQRTAWFMLHRIRHAMQTGSFEKFYGEVEVDETAIGGKERNKHLGKRTKPGGGMTGKTVVQAFIQRGDTSKAHAVILNDVGGPLMKRNVRKHVEKWSDLYTDGAGGYRGLNEEYLHEVVDHAYQYVRGSVHTNSLENYFCLLKRMLGGTYVSVEPYHLKRYVDELSFRFNARKGTDAQRFLLVLGMLSGKRLDYKTLTSSYEEYYARILP